MFIFSVLLPNLQKMMTKIPMIHLLTFQECKTVPFSDILKSVFLYNLIVFLTLLKRVQRKRQINGKFKVLKKVLSYLNHKNYQPNFINFAFFLDFEEFANFG